MSTCSSGSTCACASAAVGRRRRAVLDALDVAAPLAQVLRPRLGPLDVQAHLPPLAVQRVHLALQLRQHLRVGLQGAPKGLEMKGLKKVRMNHCQALNFRLET